jgi:UDP-N-acetylglucosamine:LPS N-acetylglucosamine transferase
MPSVELIFFDAGGGHRSAALALCEALKRHCNPWEVRLTNLQQVLDPLDLLRRLTGIRLQDSYNLMLKKGWTLGSGQLLRALQATIRAYHQEEVALLEGHWKTSEPDLVVSLVPHFNRALRESLLRVYPATPFVTILTDFADYPPHFWIEPQDQFFVCGSGKAVQQARELGIAEDRIYQTSGMILHPRFYDPIDVDRRAERRRLGLDAVLPTGLVMFGGHGSTEMLEIGQRLSASGLHLQLIMMCGRNEELRHDLDALPTRFPKLVEGFTTEIPYYMHLSDFFIGKPGPGSISEALALKLPVIVKNNAWTLPQERYNADWILEEQVGQVVSSFRDIRSAVEDLLRPGNFRRYCHHISKLNNRAVFEIPAILKGILDRRESPRAVYA